MTALRRLLSEIIEADGAVSLDQIARRIGVGPDEARAMVDYWVRKGRLSVQDLQAGCPAGGCRACPSGNGAAPGCGADPGRVPSAGTSGARGGGPVLVAITVSRRP